MPTEQKKDDRRPNAIGMKFRSIVLPFTCSTTLPMDSTAFLTSWVSNTLLLHSVAIARPFAPLNAAKSII